MTPHQQVEMIPVDRIRILNPRSRNRRQHAQIVENIRDVGLRRPITVSRTKGDEAPRYDLVCGQGRLEGFQKLGQTHIPAIVRELPEADCMLMSLVENIARRNRTSVELLSEIGQLAERGHDEAEISSIIGASEAWVRDIVRLLKHGEERLLMAVDRGVIPLSMATDIARSDNKDLQRFLSKTYTEGQIRGKRLVALRRLLEVREKGIKSLRRRGAGSKKDRTYMTPAALRRMIEREAARHRMVVKKAELAHTYLIFMVEAFRELFAQKEFLELLKAQGVPTVPQALADRLRAQAQS